MNSFFSSLPADGWQRFLCDALWQSTLIAAAGWFVARYCLQQAAARSWVLLLTLTACAVVPIASLAARANGWGMIAAEKIAAEKNGADSLPAVTAAADVRSSNSIDRAVDTVSPVEVPQPDIASTELAESPPQLTESTISAPIAAIDSDSSTEGSNAGRTVAAIPISPAASTVQSNVPAMPVPNLFRWAAIAWLSLSAILLVRLASGIFATRRLLRSAICSTNCELQTAAETAAHRLGLITPVGVMLSQKIATPMVLAFGKPVLLVPIHSSTSADQHGRQCDWTATFTHELAHVIRGDGWSRLWAELVAIMLPCSPLVWLAKRDFRIACEEACDDWAIATGADPAEFAETLTNWISSPAQPIPLAAIGMSSTKARMLRILSMKEKPMTRLRRTWRLAAMIVALACVGSIAFAQRKGIEQSTPDKHTTDSDSKSPAEDNAPPPPRFPQATEPADIKRQISELEKQSAELQKRIEWLKTVETNPPSEKTGLVSLPPYVLEPPDILLIESARLVSKDPFKIAPQDKLTLAVEGTRLAVPIRAVYKVDNSGEIELGPGYGSAHVEGLTRSEAENAITEKLRETLLIPEVSVTVDESRLAVGIAGRHLIGPDGTISLGPYGSQYVAGSTIPQAQKLIDEKLSKWFKDPIVSVDVYAYNSKVYYVINDYRGRDEYISRFPMTGNETVLDAISQIPNLGKVSDKEIWIARQIPKGNDQILKVRWNDIVSGEGTSTNYQILPGDRVFIGQPEPKPDSKDAVRSEAESPQPHRDANWALALRMVGPKTARVGVYLVYQIEITNMGSTTLKGLSASDRFDDGLQHGADQSPIRPEQPLDELKPHETKRIALTFRAMRAGKLSHTFEITGPDGLRESRKATVTVTDEATTPPTPKQESLEATGPALDVTADGPTPNSLGPAVIVKTIPEAGSAEVDPSLSEIKVTYSRDMQDKSWSWCHTSNESFPETTGDIKYLGDQRTCVMPVKLEPGKTYNIWLNWPEGAAAHNFRDSNGQAAAPYLLVFKTKAVATY